MINKVTLIGHLGQDPEIRRLENGSAVGKFSVATNENYRDKNDEWQSRTEWHNIVVWRHLAERAERDLKKGKLVYIEGKLTSRKWTDKNNIERYTTEVVANLLRLLEKRESSGGGYTNNFPTESDAPGTTNTTNSNTESPNTSAPVAETTADTTAAEGDDLPF